MDTLNDVIVAVSSASVGVRQTARSIVRLSGADVWQAIEGIVEMTAAPRGNTVVPCRVRICPGLMLDAVVYRFRSPHSYTGEDMAEIHLWAAPDAVKTLLDTLCRHTRLARPGEFTLRAYLNGKMDLTQAEAVSQIVSSANALQLAAAERLLGGKFSETIAVVRTEILELLSLVEAGLDFTEEDISFIGASEATERIRQQRQRLQEVLEGSVRLERMIDLEAVGLAGLANAGKSSLLNALLGIARSIVSPIEATTRDILTGVLELEGIHCVAFDCAGLLPDEEHRGPVDRMAHQAAVDALGRAAVVLFCTDAGKTSFEADIHILRQIKAETIIPVITKCDLADSDQIEQLSRQVRQCFKTPPIITSARNKQGLTELKSCIKNTLITGQSGTEHSDRLTLNRRHEERLEEAVKTLGQAADETDAGREDVTAMLLRQSYEILGGLERENVSEKILDSIFSRFCIGK